ncbi:MAG: plasmid partitioning protein RepB [Bosea sp. (in: a-proteobacteria)]
MSRRSVISSLIAEQLAAANSPPPDNTEAHPARVAAGPVRTMGLTLDKLELERKSLEEAVASGGAVIELDVDLIDVSFAADRLGDDNSAGHAELTQSIASNGQEVPILVRPLPHQPGRYQVAYGHRRLRACRALGRKVRAMVRPLTDMELVIAQGLENAARVDLSFIEKASFARGLEDRGFERSTVMAALGTDKTELSKLLSTARALPQALIAAVGPAPKAGRRRWMELADRLASPLAFQRVVAVLGTEEFARLPSDARFVQVLTIAARSETEAAMTAPVRGEIKTTGGLVLAKIKETPGQLSLHIDRNGHAGFADFLLRELPGIYSHFLAEDKPPANRRS